VLTLLVFIAATACAPMLTRRLRPERAQSAPEPDAVELVASGGVSDARPPRPGQALDAITTPADLRTKLSQLRSATTSSRTP
jgi:hypothetical protein